MKVTFKVAVLTCIGVSAWTACLAQGGQFGKVASMGASDGPRYYGLIRRSEVQRELKLDEKQVAALIEANKKRGPGQGIRVTLSSHTDEEEMAKEVEQQVADQLKSMENEIKGIISPVQFARLAELDLQWRGVAALADKSTAERLKISASHRAAIQKALESYRETKHETLMKLAEKADDGAGSVKIKIDTTKLDNPGSPEHKQLKVAKEAVEKSILGILTDDEKTRWKEALGKPFEFSTDKQGSRF